LSSSEPNLQNIPIRSPEGAQIREAFCAPKNHILLSADYSQIELRVMAHLSEDVSMIQAFRDDRDIHRETASKIFNTSLEEVKDFQRSQAKAVNFGVIYGMGAFRLSQDTGMSVKEAGDFIKQYFSIYQGVQQFIHSTIENSQNTLKCQTLMGRTRYLPELHSDKKSLVVQAEHMAINTPIQGSAADIVKMSMVLIQKSIDQNKLKSKIILQIHDELVFEVPLEELEEMKVLVREKMENSMTLKVPLKVVIGTGENWLLAH
jgi:DNA polymerase-1